MSNLPRVDWSTGKLHLTTLTLMHIDLHNLDLWPHNNDLHLGNLDIWTPFLIGTFDLGALDIWTWHWPWWPWTDLCPHLILGRKGLLPCLTLTFEPFLARVKVNLHTENQGCRSNGLAVRAPTDRQTDRQTNRHADARTHTHTQDR